VAPKHHHHHHHHHHGQSYHAVRVVFPDWPIEKAIIEVSYEVHVNRRTAYNSFSRDLTILLHPQWLSGLRTIVRIYLRAVSKAVKSRTRQPFDRPNVPPVQGSYMNHQPSTIQTSLESGELRNSSAIAGTINRIRIQVQVLGFHVRPTLT
jgi:hypothetical protein